ncbi:hydrogenase nickel incorporation protein HypB [Methanococcoides sp.]|uniref:Hydrogenase nickel incorporation protein HypB n=2 Tax=Methanococcoides seepicolus TaxID=2828780 RepID=A0A9E5DAL4_9EURY|nr:hydrogenase nickel incorporation protein HypB [Methanococcoides sp.]MCM1985573.1 hydrogenase nickel incorporation protein HypB [Methanococcoides seepicolus]
MLMHVINVGHDVLKANDMLAEKNKELLDKNGVFAINIMGAIGSGKTTLIEKAIEILGDHYRIAVIAGDVVADMDAARFAKLGITTIPVNTGRECHLDANLIENVLSSMNLRDIDILFMENVGNLICPTDYKLGEHLRIVIVSVTEGDDIVLKHPMIFRSADVAVIHKTDIAEAVYADCEKMERDVRQLNPNIPILLTSIRDTESIEQWCSKISSYI